MKAFLFLSLFLASVSVSTSSVAAVSVGGTRLVFNGNEKEASITVSNSNKGIPVLIQSWVDRGEHDKSKAPFTITPPLFRLEPGQDNTLRAIYSGERLPDDRESLFWLNIKSIPSIKKADMRENTLQLAIKKRLKFIYRPASIKSIPEESASLLSWKRVGNQIQVTNPTPFYMNFGMIKVGGQMFKPVLPEQTYVAPKSELLITIPSGAASNSVDWKIINDYGTSGKEFHATY